MKFENYYGNMIQEPDVNLVIEESRKKYSKALQDKQYAEYVCNLVFEEYVRTIRRSDYVWRYRIPIIKEAIEELHTKGKRKTQLHIIEHFVEKDFFKDRYKIKITDIIPSGYISYYAYNLVFTINGVKYELEIPVRDALNTENIEHALYGKYYLFYEQSESSWSSICSDYTDSGMADKIEEYFNKLNGERDGK